MKNLKRIILGIIFTILICFLIYLYINKVVIVKEGYNNLIIYIILLIIFLYYLVCYVIKPTYIKYFKIINTILGVFIIYISQNFLINSGIDGIYYGDILCLIGVVLSIIGPTNLLVSKELEDSKKVEIIEA